MVIYLIQILLQWLDLPDAINYPKIFIRSNEILEGEP